MSPASEETDGERRRGGIAASIAFALAVGALLLVLRAILFRYSDQSIMDLIPLRGFLVVLLVPCAIAVGVYAAFRARKHSGFRRLAIAAVLLALLQTIVANYIVYDRLTWGDLNHNERRALGDCRILSKSIELFHKDTSAWPIFTSSDHSPESLVDYLYGNMGEMPEFSAEARESWGSRSEDMYFTLVTNGKNGPWHQYGREVEGEYSSYSRPSAGGWAGPYLPYVTDNQQGFAYLISVSGFEGGTKPDNHIWCLSAGVNGIVDTPAWATETHGDDVGYRYDY